MSLLCQHHSPKYVSSWTKEPWGMSEFQLLFRWILKIKLRQIAHLFFWNNHLTPPPVKYHIIDEVIFTWILLIILHRHSSLALFNPPTFFLLLHADVCLSESYWVWVWPYFLPAFPNFLVMTWLWLLCQSIHL